MQELQIREATLEDAQEIAYIAAKELGYDCNPDLTKEVLKNMDYTIREKVYVAITSEKVVGFVHAEKYQTLYATQGVNLLGIAVCSNLQNQGIGSKLIAQVEEWSKEVGAEFIRVNSGGSRANAHEFYRKKGFLKEKEQKRFLKEL